MPPTAPSRARPRISGRRLLVVLAALGLTWAWLLGTAPSAYAHAELLETTPGNGEQIDTAPAEITLRFSEAVSPVDGQNTVTDDGGEEVQDGDAAASDGGKTLTIPLSDDVADGVYTVSWRVVSADSHPIHGAFVFSVGDATVAPLTGPTSETGSKAGVGELFWLFRWSGYAGLALLVGGTYFVAVCWPGGRTDSRARRLVRAGWITSVAAAVGSVLLQGPYSLGESLPSAVDPAVIADTATTDFGLATWLRLALLAAAVPLLRVLFSERWKPTRWHVGTLVALGLLIPVTWGLGGHASAGDFSRLALATDSLHLAAMSTWIGGLVVLIFCVLPRDRLQPAEAARVVPRFSRTAMVAVSVLVATGTFQAWREVRTVDALSGSDYGKLLVFKLAAFGVLLSLGALSRSVVQKRYVRPLVEEPAAAGSSKARRRVEREREEGERVAITQLRQSVRLEVAIAVGVLGLTAALVTTPPGQVSGGFQAAPAGENQPAGAAGTPFSDTLELPDDGGEVEVLLDPATAGGAGNELTLIVRDGNGVNMETPPPVVTLASADGGVDIPLEVTQQAVGQWNSSAVTIPSPGTWTLEIGVRVSDFDEATVSTDISVGAA